ncbi:MAG TPA: ribonuclease HI family protein [Acidobacteriaceae bacterium]|nr:ribonuclease HI family protein [Acidobacteriaceae bacterium]
MEENAIHGFIYTLHMTRDTSASQASLFHNNSTLRRFEDGPRKSGGALKQGLSGQTQATSAGTVTAFCDGGARGNPGPSGFGVYITDERGEKVAELSEFLGIRTNNFAEYSGLLAALEFALRYDHPNLRVISDSELMVKQIKGQYKVKSPDLRPLYEEAKRRIAGLESFQIEHVLRNKNKQADHLANLAMDKGMRKP